MARLAGRVAIVTGAARGIGLAVARAYAEEGALVHGVDVLKEELVDEMTTLTAHGATAWPHPADVSREADVLAVLSVVLEASGRIDVLANVAGIIELKSIEDTTAADWDRILGVNLRGTFLFCRGVAPVMKAAGVGSIINTSSRAGAMGFADEVAYCASKFGVEGLSRALAKELGPAGIAVNSITPGTPVRTAMSAITYGEEQRRRWQDPAVIAPAFVHLARQTPAGIHDRYVDAFALSEELRAEGWEQ
jgi:NAD(P)-dependent dehydrogenase (short-subunit alcohol dehydrogenase family)